MLFIFLLSDHDKKWDFNWKATEDNNNLHWDSGLGWRHGPIGMNSCLEILCGTSNWRDSQSTANDKNSCQRISYFRKETIQFLRDHNSQQSNFFVFLVCFF